MKPLTAARAAGFVAFTGVMVSLYVARDAVTREKRRRETRDRWVGRWSGTLLRLFGISIDLRGQAGPSARPRMVVSNHRSAIDVGILLRLFGGCMVSRADLAGWPVVGAAARSVGTVFVDRASAGSGAGTIRTIRALLDAKDTVVVFPEGTTFAGDEVRPFQAGAFIAAIRAGALVQPVGIVYPAGSQAAFVGESFPKHLVRMAGAEPTRVLVEVGAPIEAAGKRPAELAERARAAVAELVVRARERSAVASTPP